MAGMECAAPEVFSSGFADDECSLRMLSILHQPDIAGKETSLPDELVTETCMIGYKRAYHFTSRACDLSMDYHCIFDRLEASASIKFHCKMVSAVVSSQRTANSLAWSAVENGSLAVISLASLVVYSRLLSQAEFGLFSIVGALIELLSILVLMLFHDALVQRRDVTNLHFGTAFTVMIVVSIVMMRLYLR